MELMDSTPQKVPHPDGRACEGVYSMKETHNNLKKNCVHILQGLNEAAAMSQNVNCKFLKEIVNTFRAGVENVVIDGLLKGTLWL